MSEEKNEEIPYDSDAPSTEDDSDDYIDEEESKVPAPVIKKGRRGTVMAAAVTVAADWAPPVYEKGDSEKAALIDAVSKNVLFSELAQAELDVIIGAMKKLEYTKGDDIIKQGEEGDLFYVVEDGACEIFVEGVGKVMDIGGFGSVRNFFGELALLYDAPRAATVTATGSVTAWGLDRVTFKKILQDQTQKQRSLYKTFLEQVPVLQPLSVYEKLTIADAMAPKTFPAGENIINEGDEGFEFYIVESGEVICTKNLDGKETEVSDPLGPGDYFGELSLINNENRAASVKAVKDTTCLTIDRKTFKRLLGPLESMLREHEELYSKYVEDAKTSS
ncbi:hypothetical protein TrST_g7374 [Triparma strigata]|uniref:Cyclic nucleotide-binding domain-containing protein n=1 Tax=Triparma strigata TaxID=1606541 RepID=A0A9W7BWB7_9STRA|nr:hypothetical protein TrST_g7374 [Triparma strigata]